MTEKIRIVLIDDHPVLRDGLKTILNSIDEFEVIGEGENGKEAIEIYFKLMPDVVLMDLSMPEIGGVEAMEEILKKDPNAKVIILTMYEGEEDLFGAFLKGAYAYIPKKEKTEEIIKAIKSVYFGTKIIPYNIRERLRRSPKSILTEREMEVLKLISEGLSNKEIAYKLNIKLRTVKAHISSIMGKLNVSKRTEIIKKATEIGIIHL